MVQSGRNFNLVSAVGGTVSKLSGVLANLNTPGIRSVGPNEVRLNGDRIEWRISQQSWGERADATECLWDFLELASEDDPAVFLKFAELHGVLGLDEHAEPGTNRNTKPQLVDGTNDWYWEPIEAWKAWAKLAKSMLVVSEALKVAQGDDLLDIGAVLTDAGFDLREHLCEDGSIIIPQHPPYLASNEAGDVWLSGYATNVLIDLPPRFMQHNLESYKDSLQDQRQWFSYFLSSQWIAKAAISPVVVWPEGNPQLSFALSDQHVIGWRSDFWFWPKNTLFSVLAAQLASVICSDLHVAQCARCCSLHSSKSKVRRDQNHYCSECRVAVRRATNRDSMAKRYAAKRAAAKQG